MFWNFLRDPMGWWTITIKWNEPEITGHLLLNWIQNHVICLILAILVCFYFETPHQNDLKLLAWPHGVVNYNHEVKLFWNNRAFSFKLNPKSYVIWLILEFLVGFYFETLHQNVLKLLGWPYGVVNYNHEVKLAWNNRAFSFKLNPNLYLICLILDFLVGFYFETPHQNVLKLLAWPHGVMIYNLEVKWAWNNRAFSFKLNPKSCHMSHIGNPEVKWAWNNRAFSFKSNPKSYVICLIFGGLLFWNYASECPETSWVTLWGLELSPCSEMSLE
jgi:hypothetical protein